MIERSMSVEVDSAPYLVFNPRSGSNFNTIRIPIPGIEWEPGERRFHRECQEQVKAACGAVSCSSLTFVETEKVGDSNLRRVTGATIQCHDEDCPLIDPPSSGDREPLEPAPQPPALQVEAELPLVPFI